MTDTQIKKSLISYELCGNLIQIKSKKVLPSVWEKQTASQGSASPRPPVVILAKNIEFNDQNSFAMIGLASGF